MLFKFNVDDISKYQYKNMLNILKFKILARALEKITDLMVAIVIFSSN